MDYGHTILLGIGGSHAHGLAHANSDYDYRGVFSHSTEDFFLVDSTPKDHYVSTSVEFDQTIYELAKYLKLAVKGNPDALELLGLDTFVDVDEEWGVRLLELGPELMGAVPMKAAYLGYARQQFHKMRTMSDDFPAHKGGRLWKHAKHMFRLLETYSRFVRTGKLTVRVTDPTYYTETLPNMSREELYEAFENYHDEVEELKPVGNLYPNIEAANRFLIDYRKAH